MNPFESTEYRQSRTGFIVFAVFEYLITLSVSDVYLSKLLLALQFTDAQIGVLSSLISVSFLFGLSVLFLVRRIRQLKRHIIVRYVISQTLFSCLYLVPFLGLSRQARLLLILAMILAAYYFSYSVRTLVRRLAYSYVSPKGRSKYSALLESVCLIFGMVFTLGLGLLMDAFEQQGKLSLVFLLMAGMDLLFTVGVFFSLRSISAVNTEEQVQEFSAPLKEVIQNTLGRREFRNIVILHMLYCSALYLSSSFMGTYRLNELAFSMVVVQLINMGSNILRAVFSGPFGRYSDKRSYAGGILLALVIMCAAYAIGVLVAPQTRWLMIVFSVLFNVSLGGTGYNLENIVFDCVPARYYVQASVLKHAIAGVCGFLITLVGGTLLSAVQANGNRLFGITVYGQQVLSLISLLLCAAACVFCKAVVMKQKRLEQ